MKNLSPISEDKDILTKDYIDDLKINKLTDVVVGFYTYHSPDDVDYLCDGAADDVEIRAAVQEVEGGNKSRVVILAGNYKITSEIQIRYSGVVVEGLKGYTTLTRDWDSSSEEGILMIRYTSGVCIKDLTINGDNSTYTSANNVGIYLNGSDDNVIENVEFVDNEIGVLSFKSERNKITSNHFSGNETGIKVEETLDRDNDNYIAYNFLENNNLRGIYATKAGGNIIVSNIIESPPASKAIEINNAKNNIVLSNKTFQGSIGIAVKNNSANNVVSNNIFRDASTQIEISVSAIRNHISENICIRGTGQASDYGTYDYTIWVRGTNNDYNQIINNFCMGKAIENDGGTGNSIYGNKYNENNNRNVLELDNTNSFTPTDDYNPATKKYVDDNAGGLPGTEQDVESVSGGSVDYSESFESGLGDWETSGPTGGWARLSGATGSSGTGPSSAYDGSYYVYVETSSSDSNTAGDTDILEYTPSETFTGSVSFAYHQYGSDQGTLSIEKYDGSTWTEIWSSAGDQGNQWNVESVNVSGATKIRFKNVAAGGYRGDVALDSIHLNNGDNTATVDRNYKHHKIELSGDVTIAFENLSNNTKDMTIKLVQDASGGHDISWADTILWEGGTEPTWSTGANDIDIVRIYYDGSNYYGSANLDMS